MSDQIQIRQSNRNKINRYYIEHFSQEITNNIKRYKIICIF